jgi:hypothetical protein
MSPSTGQRSPALNFLTQEENDEARRLAILNEFGVTDPHTRERDSPSDSAERIPAMVSQLEGLMNKLF